MMRIHPVSRGAGRLLCLVGASGLVLAPAPALALLPAPASVPEAGQTAPNVAIEARPGVVSDEDIARRIDGIFSQIPALRAIEVTSSEGVVRLSGSVPAAGDINRAEAIAARVAGVVTVENGLARDLAIDASLAPALGNISDIVRDMLRALPLLGVATLVAILIGVFGYVVAGRERLWRMVTPNAFLAELVATSIRFLFVLIGIVAALEIMGATALLGAVLGGAGVIGIALGFAVRDTIDNYVSSLMLSLRQPFRANDHVVIEGSEGRVIRLTSRATILMTLDGNHLRIPNSTVFKAVILNYSRNPERRFEFALGIDADDDPVRGMAVGLQAVSALDFVLASPRPNAIITEVGDSNIMLRFFGWVDQTRTEFLKGRSLAIQTAKKALEAEGFALPEPIYRLRFDAATPVPQIPGDPKIPGLTQERTPKTPAPSGAKVSAVVTQDTAPEDHIERMVSDERADSSKQDLLDSRRPVE